MSTRSAQPAAFVKAAKLRPVNAGPLIWRDSDLLLVPAELYSRQVAAGETVQIQKPDRDMIVMLKE